jgi:SLT domain-containing protein
MDDGASQRTAPVAYKRGGKVKRTGPALTHKNERVIPAGKRKKVERLMKKSRMKMTDKGRKG